MASLDEVVALLYGARRRVGPFTAELRIWQGRGPEGPESGSESRWRVTQDGPRYRWELVHGDATGRKRADGPAELLMGDGNRAWARHRDRLVINAYQGCLVSDLLLDPSWLLSGYDLSITGASEVDGRPSVDISGTRTPVRRGTPPASEAVEASVDSERGFLHRLTELTGGVSVEVIELSDLRLDMALDDAAFSVPPGRHPVEDRTTRRRHLPRRLKTWRRANQP